MDYLYEQVKDYRWRASGPVEDGVANTVSGALRFAGGQVAHLPTVTSNGACQGISMWWLIKNALGQDFWDWFGASKSSAAWSRRTNATAGEPVAKIQEIMKLQAAMPFSRRQNHEAAVNYILSKTRPHLVKRRGLVLRTNQSFRSMAYEVTAKQGYVFIGFSKQNWGGHAVAAHIRNDGSIAFMDPNAGEWEINSYADFYHLMEHEVGNGLYGGMRLDTVEIQTLERPA